MARVGRPQSNNPKSITYSIRLDADTEKRLNKYCNRYHICKGAAIRKGIELLLNYDKGEVTWEDEEREDLTDCTKSLLE